MELQTSTATTSIFPFMRYENAPKAIDWLERAFGFQCQLRVPGPDGTIAHAELRLGNGMIMLGSSKDDDLGLTSPRSLARVTQGIYVALEDIDAHYQRALAAGADIVRELADTEYGSREYLARDPEGHLWSFGTYRPADALA
jgi:uncharacterized glyoxalase superfamily protein PhnB